MPSFGVQLPHALGKSTAIERLRDFATAMHAEHQDRLRDMQQRWEDNLLHFSFSTSGMAISGRVVVEEAHARVEGQLPFAAVLFRGKIEQEIRAQLEKLLG